MRRRLFLVCVLLPIVSSCLAPNVTIPNATGLAKEELSIIKKDLEIHPDVWDTYIVGVRDLSVADSNWIKLKKAGRVNVAPGDYEVLLYASVLGYNQERRAFPSTRIHARPGKTYLIHCVSAERGKVRAEVRELDSSADTTSSF